MAFSLFDADYSPPSVALTLKLKANPHKVSDKQPALTGFLAISQQQLNEIQRLINEGPVFLRVALWDDTDRGDKEYPINGVIEYKEYTPKDKLEGVKYTPNTEQWF